MPSFPITSWHECNERRIGFLLDYWESWHTTRKHPHTHVCIHMYICLYNIYIHLQYAHMYIYIKGKGLRFQGNWLQLSRCTQLGWPWQLAETAMGWAMKLLQLVRPPSDVSWLTKPPVTSLLFAYHKP
jgi:hypothetical protein